MKAKTRRVAVIFIGLVCLLLAISAVVTWRIIRQDRLNEALTSAVLANDTDAAIRLLRQGADANARDDARPAGPVWQWIVALLRGSKPKPSTAPTPLLLALTGDGTLERDGSIAYPPENVTLIRSLLEHGADVNVECPDLFHLENVSPLYIAVMTGKATTVHLLLEHGADANWQNSDKLGPLDRAAINCQEHPGVVQDLIDHGADVNQRGLNGNTPLFFAVVNRNISAVKLLLAHHADMTIREFNEFPLDFAKMVNDQETIRLLKAAGAKR